VNPLTPSINSNLIARMHSLGRCPAVERQRSLLGHYPDCSPATVGLVGFEVDDNRRGALVWCRPNDQLGMQPLMIDLCVETETLCTPSSLRDSHVDGSKPTPDDPHGRVCHFTTHCRTPRNQSV
jgi:hypothetical protein